MDWQIKETRQLININQSALSDCTEFRKMFGYKLTYLAMGFMTISCQMLNIFWRAKVYLRKPYFWLIIQLHAHPNSLKSGDIEVRIFPRNVTSLVQPMDHDVIECFKQNCWQFFFSGMKWDETLKDGLNRINMKHVLHWHAQSWNCLLYTSRCV